MSCSSTYLNNRRRCIAPEVWTFWTRTVFWTGTLRAKQSPPDSRHTTNSVSPTCIPFIHAIPGFAKSYAKTHSFCSQGLRGQCQRSVLRPIAAHSLADQLGRQPGCAGEETALQRTPDLSADAASEPARPVGLLSHRVFRGLERRCCGNFLICMSYATRTMW